MARAPRGLSNRLLQCGVLVFALVVFSAPVANARGNQDALTATYQKMVEADPYDAYALRRLLEVSQSQGGVGALLDTYRERTRAHPDDRVAWTLIGHLLRALQDRPGAVEAFERAAALRDKDPRPWVAVAAIWREAQRWEPMLRAYEAALERGSGRDARGAILEEAAQAALDADQLQLALTWLASYRELHAASVVAAMTCAEILTRYGKNEEALEAWVFAERRARSALSHTTVIWRRMGVLLEEMGRLEEAEALWRRAMAATPERNWSYGIFLEGLARVYRRKDRLPELAEELKRTARKRPLVQAMLARVYDELGNDAEALHWLDLSITRDSRNTELHERRIALLRRRGELPALERAYESLIRAAPAEARYGLELVDELLRYGHLSRGMKRLDRVVAQHRRDPGVWQRAISLLVRYAPGADGGRVERAYRVLLKLEPREPAHLVSLGESLWSAGDRPGALKLWKRLTRLGSRPGLGHLLYAEVLADHQLEREAREAFEDALRASPTDATIIETAARWFENQSRSMDRARAAELWSTLLDLGTDATRHPRAAARRAHARRHLVELWERTRSVGSRLEQLSARYAAQPDDLSTGLLLVELYLHLGRLDDADKLLGLLTVRVPDHVEILRLRVALLTRTHRLAEALPLLRRIANLDPRGGDAAIHRAAEIAHALGDDAQALELSQEAIRRHPGDGATHLRAGEIRLRLGDREAAAEAWRKALRLNPRDDELRMRLAALYRDLDATLQEERVLIEVVRDASAPGRVQRAGRRLLELARQHDRLAAIERVLRPLALAQGRRAPIHRRLLVDLYLDQAEGFAWSEREAEGADERLTQLGTRGLETLLFALEGDDAAVRTRALRVLRLTRPAGAIPSLARMLSKGDGASRFHAAITLGAIGGGTAIHALAKVLETRGSSELHSAAIWALGLIPTDGARELLLAHTSADHARLHTLVALALSHHPHQDTVGALKRLASRVGTRPHVAALWSLAMLERDDAIPPLAHALRAGAPEIEQIAAWGLGRADTEASRRLLLDALVAGSGPAAHLLVHGLVAPPNVTRHRHRALYQLLIDAPRGRVTADPSPLVGATVMAERGTMDAARLQRLLGRIDERYTRLGQGGDLAFVARLLEPLATGDGLDLPRSWSITALSREASRQWAHRLARRFVPTLEGALHEQRSTGDRLLAVDYLTRIDARASETDVRPRLFAVLEGLLEDPDRRVRASAWRAAARLPAARLWTLVKGAVLPSTPASAAFSHDAEPLAYALAVASCPPEHAGPLLAELLRHPSARVRRAAAQGAHSEHVDLVALLIDLLDDPVVEVARAAARALERGQATRGLEALERVRLDGDPRALLKSSG